MAKNFQELRGKMSAGAREASDTEYRRLVEEMSLHQLRKARELTQTKIAEELHMGQGDVSELERRTDMYVSTLARERRNQEWLHRRKASVNPVSTGLVYRHNCIRSSGLRPGLRPVSRQSRNVPCSKAAEKCVLVWACR